MIPSTIGGLPTHALIIHFVVVILPAAVIAFAGIGWREPWRRTYALPVALVAIGAVIAAFIATESGEALRDQVRDAAGAAGTRADFGDHPEDGELVRNLAILFALIACAFWATMRWQGRFEAPKWLSGAIYGVGCLVGAVTVVALVSAGHSGSALVWRDLGNFVRPK